MKFHIDQTLRNHIHETHSDTRLRRNSGGLDPHAFLGKTLATLEASGDAMRYLDRKGRIAWRATRQLRSTLADLQADAETDSDEEAI